MAFGLRVGAGLAVALCGWIAADGLRRSGAGGPAARIYVPWDANSLPESVSERGILALRPVSAFARFRDALTRADGPDGEAFRSAARGVLRWGRNQPGTLLDLGRVALERFGKRGEVADRAIGEALLGEYVVRTTHAEDEAARVWLEFAPGSPDPWIVFGRARKESWLVLGAVFAESHPDAAWKFVSPSLFGADFDGPRWGAVVLGIATRRHDPRDLPLLRALATRSTLLPDTARDLGTLVRDLEDGR